MLQRLELTGSPYDRGIQHGEAFNREIENNAHFYIEYLADMGIEEHALRAKARELGDYISEQYGEYAEEMQGVADGSDVPLEAVTIINIRHTLIYSVLFKDDTLDKSPITTEGCTSFGLLPEATATERTYVGQNWDWQTPVETFIMDIRRNERPDVLALTEAGNVGGKFGLNEHGIGFVINALSTPSDGEHFLRKPAHVRGKEILNAERFDRAIAPVIEDDRPTSRNYMIGHSSGEVVDLETAPETFEFLYPENGILTHANHFERRSTVRSQYEKRSPDSVFRANRALRLFSNLNGTIEEDEMIRVLRDHFSKPRSICRHEEETDDYPTQTKASILMDLQGGRMLAADGPPCENEYEEFAFES